MGKRSAKCHIQKKFVSVEKNLLSYLRDTFPDESNDSGHGSDASLLNIPDVSTSNSCNDSDVGTSSDSVDSGTCRHWSSCSSLITSSSSSSVHFDSNLSSSLKSKMHIHSLDAEVKPRVMDMDVLAEPLAKRRKMLGGDERHGSRTDICQDSSHQSPALRRLPSSGVHNGVLVDTSLCHNLIGGKRPSPGHLGSCSDDDLNDKEVGTWSSNDNFAFHGSSEHPLRCKDRIAALLSVGPNSLTRKRPLKKPSLHVCFPSRSKDGKMELSIVVQPEEQHRARYMTEGSRGSIKDEKGTCFPTVKLHGYNQPVVLQVFIGADNGKVLPHLFYQACKVTGKNCAPCMERMIDGTSVIEMNMLPENDMTVSCDCIGILKERNVDVEQRLPYFGLARCKKRSTRCRMVFRVNVPLASSSVETLQAASSQILCTQSPGLPEICKKSMTECPANGGMELFIVGKNFQKDSKVMFQELTSGHGTVGRKIIWEEIVDPEKEFLHQSHLICTVPAFRDPGIQCGVKVYLSVLSGGKSSEPHTFTYTPCHSAQNEHFDGRRSSFHSDISSSSFEHGKNMMSLSNMVSMSGSRRVSTDMLNGLAGSSSALLSPGSGLSSMCSSHSSLTSPVSSSSASSTGMHILPEHSHLTSASADSKAALSDCHSRHAFCASVCENTHSMNENSSDVVNMPSGYVNELTSVSSLPSTMTELSSHQDRGQKSLLSLSPHLSLVRPLQETQLSSHHNVFAPHLSSQNHTFESSTGMLGSAADHDVDLMNKIDQLATAMTQAEDIKASPRDVLTETRSSSLADTVNTSFHTGSAIQQQNGGLSMSQMSMDHLNNSIPLISVSSSLCSQNTMSIANSNINGNGVFASVSADMKPPEGLASLVSAMNNGLSPAVAHLSTPNAGKCPTYENDAVFATTYGLPQDVGATTVTANIKQEDQICNMNVKPQVSAILENLNRSREQYHGSSVCVGSPSEAFRGLTPVNGSEEIQGMSYNVQCCSAINQMSVVRRYGFCQGMESSIRAPDSGSLVGGKKLCSDDSTLTSTPMLEAEKMKAEPHSAASGTSAPFTTAAKSVKQDMGSMTLAFSQLSDADLLSMINPSTFDSV